MILNGSISTFERPGNLRRTGCQTSTCQRENMRPPQPVQALESFSLEKSHGVHLNFDPARMEMQI
jgi:hypothetical protein